MVIFSNLEQAVQEGFHWLEYLPQYNLHLIERSFTRADGQKVRALAYARGATPTASDP